jgi:hypothetical protein
MNPVQSEMQSRFALFVYSVPSLLVFLLAVVCSLPEAAISVENRVLVWLLLVATIPGGFLARKFALSIAKSKLSLKLLFQILTASLVWVCYFALSALLIFFLVNVRWPFRHMSPAMWGTVDKAMVNVIHQIPAMAPLFIILYTGGYILIRRSVISERH